MILKKVTVKDQVYDLITRGERKTGNRRKLYITNLNGSVTAKIYLYLEDASSNKYYYASGKEIATETTLEVDVIPFDSSVYSFRFMTTSNSPNVDIIYG